MKLFRFCLSLCGISDISGSLLAVSYYSTEVWFSGNCVLSFLCSGLLVIASHTNHTVLFFSLQWNPLLLPVKKNPSLPSLPKFFFFTAKNREWERPTGHQVLKIENVHATAWIIRWNIKIIVLLVFYTSCFLFVEVWHVWWWMVKGCTIRLLRNILFFVILLLLLYYNY